MIKSTILNPTISNPALSSLKDQDTLTITTLSGSPFGLCVEFQEIPPVTIFSIINDCVDLSTFLTGASNPNIISPDGSFNIALRQKIQSNSKLVVEDFVNWFEKECQGRKVVVRSVPVVKKIKDTFVATHLINYDFI